MHARVSGDQPRFHYLAKGMGAHEDDTRRTSVKLPASTRYAVRVLAPIFVSDMKVDSLDKCM